MNNLKSKLKKQGGFTLIEMLIVVAIIAILIAIAIPMVNSALENAREATDAANERAAIGMAMVEVLSTNKLAGQTVGTTAVSAVYKIEKNKGSLVASTTAGIAAGATNYNYGKGTAAGEVKDNHANGYLSVTYTPATTTTEDDFTVSWTVPTT